MGCLWRMMTARGRRDLAVGEEELKRTTLLSESIRERKRARMGWRVGITERALLAVLCSNRGEIGHDDLPARCPQAYGLQSDSPGLLARYWRSSVRIAPVEVERVDFASFFLDLLNALHDQVRSARAEKRCSTSLF